MNYPMQESEASPVIVLESISMASMSEISRLAKSNSFLSSLTLVEAGDRFAEARLRAIAWTVGQHHSWS